MMIRACGSSDEIQNGKNQFITEVKILLAIVDHTQIYST